MEMCIKLTANDFLYILLDVQGCKLVSFSARTTAISKYIRASLGQECQLNRCCGRSGRGPAWQAKPCQISYTRPAHRILLRASQNASNPLVQGESLLLNHSPLATEPPTHKQLAFSPLILPCLEGQSNYALQLRACQILIFSEERTGNKPSDGERFSLADCPW